MEKLKKILILILKILTSLPLSTFYIVSIVFCIFLPFETHDGYIFFFLMIVLNSLLLWYVNWAIWTKGIKRKAFLSIIIFILTILFKLITME